MSEDGLFVRIPLHECLLSDAVNLVEDPTYWDETLPAVLFHFRLSIDDYWRLTVHQHRQLVDFLTARGLYGKP